MYCNIVLYYMCTVLYCTSLYSIYSSSVLLFWPRRLACAMRACVRHAKLVQIYKQQMSGIEWGGKCWRGWWGASRSPWGSGGAARRSCWRSQWGGDCWYHFVQVIKKYIFSGHYLVMAVLTNPSPWSICFILYCMCNIVHVFKCIVQLCNIL